jgi:hypothetical protein
MPEMLRYSGKRFTVSGLGDLAIVPARTGGDGRREQKARPDPLVARTADLIDERRRATRSDPEGPET